MSRGLDAAQFELSREAVRGRFQWARRQGNPQWLWPDVSVAGWQSALVEIEQAVGQVLAKGQPAKALAGHPDEIGIAAYTSGMGPLLGYWLTIGALDAEPPLRALLELHYRHNSERMQRLADHAIAAVAALADSGLSVTVLKGMHTAFSHFPVPGARPVSDIDLLIRAADEAVAAEALASLGYRRCGASHGEQTWRLRGTPIEPRTLAFVHRDDPWSIDLHLTLDRQYSAGAPMLRMDRALAAGAAAAWPLSPRAKALAGAELVVHLAGHASLGLLNLSLLRQTELILVIRKAESESRTLWDDVLRIAERTGSVSCIYPALRMAGEVVPGTVPDEVLTILEREAPAPVRRVIARLTPATCQRLLRCSFEERFMWTGTLGGWAREVFDGLVPLVSLDQIGQIHATRLWRLARGTVSR